MASSVARRRLLLNPQLSLLPCIGPRGRTPELSVVDWFERRQIPLYLAALVIGAVVGVVAPGTAPTLEGTINPTLALLLYATFLGVPMARSSGRSRMAGSSAAPCSSTSSQSRSSSSR